MQLDLQIKAIVDTQHSLPLLASHPVYQYLARRYQLNLQSLMWEPEQFPDATQWQLLKNSLLLHPAKWMLWEAEPKAETIDRLKGMSINSLVYYLLGNRPDSGDFISVMQANVKNLQAAFMSPR